MSACKCSERSRPLRTELPEGSNERPRQWFVTSRNESRSAFNGYRPMWSDYSNLHCRVCGAWWRSSSKVVGRLSDCEFFPGQVAPTVPAWGEE